MPGWKIHSNTFKGYYQRSSLASKDVKNGSKQIDPRRSCRKHIIMYLSDQEQNIETLSHAEMREIENGQKVEKKQVKIMTERN